MKISVIGLGFVGKAVAQLCASKGLEVYGIDINIKQFENLANTKNLLLTNSYLPIKESDVVFVCVPTPINYNKLPDITFLKNAFEKISDNLKKGQLIIIESSIGPGTTRELSALLEKHGLQNGSDFHLVHCAERIDLGNIDWHAGNIPRVLGGLDEKGIETAYNFLTNTLGLKIIKTNSVEAAEMVKMLENTYRYVNISLINEFALVCEKYNADVNEVISAASTKPFGFMPFYPGPGVGGHCIPVDPHYLEAAALKKGVELKLIKHAKEINEKMANHIVDKMLQTTDTKKIGVLGVSFKKNTADARESPALRIIDLLKENNIEVGVFDPLLKGHNTVNNADDLLNNFKHLILVTDHDEFVSNLTPLLREKDVKIIFDARNCLDKQQIKSYGVTYLGIGR